MYFGGWNHDVTAVDKHTGVRRWRSTTPETSAGTLGGSVVVVGDIVAFGDLRIYAYSRLDGALRWVFSGTDGGAVGYYDMSTDGQTIYAGSPTGRVYALDAATGTPRWDITLASEPSSSAFDPLVREGTVYVCLRHETMPTTGGVVALDAATGAVRWSQVFPPEPIVYQAACVGRVVVVGDVVVGVTLDGHIYAMDTTTGAMRWAAPQLSNVPPGSPGNPQNDARPLVASGGLVVAGSTTGYMTAYDGATGAEHWRATANRGSAFFPPSADDTRVYSIYSGMLASFDAATGTLKWTSGVYNGQGEYAYAVAVDGDRIYAGGHHGLYALRK